MSDGQKLPAVCYRLTAYRYPLSYWTVFPKAGGGARLRRRGDSPALTHGLRVVFASLRGRIRAAALEYIPGFEGAAAVSPGGDEYKCCLRQQAPFGGWRHHLSPYSGGTMGAGLLSQFVFMEITAKNHITGLRPEENRQTALRAFEMHPFCLRHLPRRGRF